MSDIIGFDADCGVCSCLAARLRLRLESRGFRLVPLQGAESGRILGLPDGELLKEMRVLTSGGTRLGGADALLYVAARTRGLSIVARCLALPGVRPLFAAAYRWFAAHRHALGGSCARKEVS
ncbi:MAG: DUF393 domain-containing protein [Acidobacteria bacterium]|nr:DUF393 domain-containing protein [Acidobacteriota bacterium]